MQPPLSKGDREALRAISRRRKDWAQRIHAAGNLQSAIHALSELNSFGTNTHELLASNLLANVSREKIDSALECLNRFAMEFANHEKAESAKN